ncbi:hypothetical protein D3C72_1708130 [compost metagenome]
MKATPSMYWPTRSCTVWIRAGMWAFWGIGISRVRASRRRAPSIRMNSESTRIESTTTSIQMKRVVKEKTLESTAAACSPT